MHKVAPEITKIILKAAEKARKESSSEPEPENTKRINWPVDCTVGPGLEGATACETKIGYVNGSKGWLVYQGYDIFDLCAHSTFEETSYLLLHGSMPTQKQLDKFNDKLVDYRFVDKTMRLLMSFPVEDMNPMAGLRIGSNMMRMVQTYIDHDIADAKANKTVVATDEDSIDMGTKPKGDKKATFEFKGKVHKRPKEIKPDKTSSEDFESCYHLIAGMATITAGIYRLRQGKLPIEPRRDLGHAANLLYMMTGEVPTPEAERIMDVSLILHADHGMNASTFASMVVASTMSDIYFSIGAGIGALNGPLHGGANEAVLHMLAEIGEPENVEAWYKKARAKKKKIMGFGHRVYKAYDPRARVLGPLAEYLVRKDPKAKKLLKIATKLEKEVVGSLGESKGIFPNVDFYSGIVYTTMGIAPEMYTPIFAVSRVSGWCARVLEYLKNNRIFRPRAMYVGEFGKEIEPIEKRKKAKKK